MTDVWFLTDASARSLTSLYNLIHKICLLENNFIKYSFRLDFVDIFFIDYDNIA